MDEDQCDFETLSAILDSPDDADQNAVPDDLSDNELDQLAALIEQEHCEKSENPRKENRSNDETSLAKDSTTVETEAANGTNLALIEELRTMQEKVRMLEAQISQQSKDSPSSAVTCNPELRAGSSKSGSTASGLHQKKVTVNEPSGPSRQSVVTTPNQVPSRGIKEVEKDIFSGDQLGDISKTGQQTSRYQSSCRKDQRRDSGSDWDELDGNEKSELSKSGQELKQLLKAGTGKRVAHRPSEDLRSTVNSHNWKDKASATYVASLVGIPDHSKSLKTSASSTKRSEVDEKILKDSYSGIRIINPKVSSTQLQSLMENRRMIRLSVLPTKTHGNDIDGDWVTIGVIVHKSEQRKSAKGTNFSFWKLSDLNDCEKTVTFFLFGNVNKELWKTSVGSVIGILNASIMQNAEKNFKHSNELSITVDKPQKVLIMGQSKDMGTCRGQTKNGSVCTNVVNVQQGEYCTYHVQAAYRKMASKRSEIQSGHSGIEPKSFRQVLAKSGSVIYGGSEYFSTTPVAKKKDKVSIKSLQQHHVSSVSGSGKARLNTLALHDILPEDMALLESQKQTASDDKNKVFHDLLTVPSVGAMNFVKHLQKTDKSQTAQSKNDIQSISASELLKKYKKETTALMDRRKKPDRTKSEPSELTVRRSETNNGVVAVGPQLGRGLREGDSVFLDDLPSKQKTVDAAAVKDLKNAAAIIKAKGGIVRQDPNAVKKENSSKTRELIKKRVLESADGNHSSEDQPSSKKTRLLNGLDLNSPEIQRLLHAKSAHAALVTEAEQEKQEAYFDVLEKTERMEEKMLATTEVKCTAVTCVECKYTALSAAQSCRDESHHLKMHPATKRFYRCKDCNKRCTTLDKMPTSCCKQCGGTNYERTSMMPAKSGPKLPTEQLLLRGEERKFIS